MQNDAVRLREQAAKARRLAVQTSDQMATTKLRRYADECDANADRLETARQTAEDQPSHA